MLSKWLFAPPKWILPLPIDQGQKPEGKGKKLLEEAGYEVLCGKIKIPIRISDHGKILRSQYFIDYIAKKDQHYFLVKMEKARMPVEWTGAQVRDRLMPYWLLYAPVTKGLLFIESGSEQIHELLFDIGGQE